MTDKIRRLLELQELGITLSESEILHGKQSETDTLKARQTNLRNEIDSDSLAKYDRLSKLGLAVVQVKGNMCLGCHMSIPAGDLNRMIKNQVTAECPNCGRFLNLDTEE